MSDFLRDMSFEELQALQSAIQREIESRDRSALWVRCQMCNGTGRRAEGYCLCATGEDLWRVERGSGYEIPE